jgi:hypothetical protein
MRRMTGRLPFRITALAAVAVLLIVAGRAAGSGVPTIHPTWLWTDLRPIGDGDITYDPCDAWTIPPQWSYGVENWDAVMGSLMDFDQDICGADEVPVVHLRWEDPDHQCPEPEWYGCPWPLAPYPPPWQRALITFDYDIYSSYNNSKKTAAAAHEWGHMMDLASVSQQNCDQAPTA